MADYSAMSDRELDAAVAEKVMGWSQHPHMHDCWDVPSRSDGYRQKHYWCPSTDLYAAWEVVERMRAVRNADGYRVWRFLMDDSGDAIEATFQQCEYLGRPGRCDYIALHPSATRSICLAALAAVEAKEKTNA